MHSSRSKSGRFTTRSPIVQVEPQSPWVEDQVAFVAVVPGWVIEWIPGHILVRVTPRTPPRRRLDRFITMLAVVLVREVRRVRTGVTDRACDILHSPDTGQLLQNINTSPRGVERAI